MRLTIALVSMFAAVAPAASGAQTTFRTTPTLVATQVYDTNVFYTSAAGEPDLITRVTPGLRTALTSPRWTFDAAYALDAERFAARDELSSAVARQQAHAALGYRSSARFTLTAAGEISSTKTPTELNQISGLTIARAPAVRTAGRSAIVRHFNPLTTGTMGYAFTDDRVEGGVDVRTHAATAAVNRRLSPRSAVSAQYRIQRFLFDASPEMSHALNLGWTRTLAPGAVLSIAGGPNVTGASTGLDLSLAIRDRIDSLERSIAYVRSQTTAVGLPGIVRTQSLSAHVAWAAGRSLTLQLAPAVYRSAHEALEADIFRLALFAARALGRSVSLEVGLGASVQRGDLYPGQANQTIARQEITVRLTAGAPTRSR